MKGVLFEANNGKSIFLPADGYWLNSLGSIPIDALGFSISSDFDNNIINSPRYAGPVLPYGWPFCPTN